MNNHSLPINRGTSSTFEIRNSEKCPDFVFSPFSCEKGSGEEKPCGGKVKTFLLVESFVSQREERKKFLLLVFIPDDDEGLFPLPKKEERKNRKEGKQRSGHNN